MKFPVNPFILTSSNNDNTFLTLYSISGHLYLLSNTSFYPTISAIFDRNLLCVLKLSMAGYTLQSDVRASPCIPLSNYTQVYTDTELIFYICISIKIQC